MKYKTFRNLVVLCFVVVLVGGIWALSKRSPKEPATSRPRPVPTVAQAATSVPVAAAPTAPQAAPVSPASPGDPSALRPMDTEILARVKQGISGDKEKDAVRGRSYKVNLYKDAGFTSVNRLKLDLNRNEKADEKWTFASEGGRETVKRQVAPADDEKYTQEYLLEGGKWVRQK